MAKVTYGPAVCLGRRFGGHALGRHVRRLLGKGVGHVAEERGAERARLGPVRLAPDARYAHRVAVIFRDGPARPARHFALDCQSVFVRQLSTRSCQNTKPSQTLTKRQLDNGTKFSHQ